MNSHHLEDWAYRAAQTLQDFVDAAQEAAGRLTGYVVRVCRLSFNRISTCTINQEPDSEYISPSRLPASEKINLSKIIKFVLDESDYKYMDFNRMFDAIEKHIEYGTCMVIYDDDKEIVALCRWNFDAPMLTAHIADLIIRRDWREKDLIKRMLIRGLQMYPQTKWLTFERREKYPGRKHSRYKIEDLLKHRKKKE